MQAKTKIKQNNNKVKDWAWETALAEIFFLSGKSSKFPSGVKPRFIEPVGESQTLEGWCSLALRQLQTIYMAPRPGLCFAPAATWNLHTTQPRAFPQLTMRLSISPVCCKQRIERIKW
jgi:hypothetical protein